MDQQDFDKDYEEYIEHYWNSQQGLKDLEQNIKELNELNDLLENKLKHRASEPCGRSGKEIG